MKLRYLALLLSLCLCAATVGGCTANPITPSGGADGADTADGAFRVRQLTAAPAPLIIPHGKQEDSAKSAAEGANDFAFRLSAALAESSEAENLVCSPFSVWLPLAALANATDETHKAALLEALCAAAIPVDALNRAASRMLYDMTGERERQEGFSYGTEVHNPLSLVNAVFVDTNMTLRQDFAQTFFDFYRGSAVNVDFRSREAVDAINQWASDNTNGLISNIVQELDPNTVAAIANAIYFSDRWTCEFDPEETKEATFHAPGGDTKAFFMLREGDNQPYYEDDTLQAMPLRFKTGGGLYILLPKNGSAAELLSSMTSEYFSEIQSDSIFASGKLLLPRFSAESSLHGLKDVLETLGVPLFDEQAAPLTGGLLEEDVSLWLSDALQKAVIRVDEKGTTAAAVTVLPAAGTAMPIPTKPFEMVCDKPFAFVLYTNTYDGGAQVLFTGIVNQPERADPPIVYTK